MRAVAHYLLAVLILSVYGVQVCPFLDSLTPLQLVGPLVAALGVQAGLRWSFFGSLIAAAPPERQVRRTLEIEFTLFFASGILVATFNTLYFGFPAESGLKVVVGFATLGFFAAVDLALAREHRLIERFERTGEHLSLTPRFFPLSAKLGLFAAICVVVVLAVVFLVINKDLQWLSEVGRSVDKHAAQRAILGELAFVVGVVLAHVLNVITSYTRNLKRFLSNENGALAAATAGDLEAAVPVGSNDEFGVMAHHTNVMVDSLRARTEEIKRTQDVTILALASLAETRDNETGAHILRTQRYVRALAEHLRHHPRFQSELADEEAIDLLFKSAPLHDIGKVGIPDAILLKPGKLDDDEFGTMKTHAALGDEALARAEKELGESSFLRYAREIALTHHEKWDGTGYPRGLVGEDIPVSGRLMAVADVYDALISKRVYKPAFPHEKAVSIIQEGKGKHFDPDVVEALLGVEQTFRDIASEFSDGAYGEAPAS